VFGRIPQLYPSGPKIVVESREGIPPGERREEPSERSLLTPPATVVPSSPAVTIVQVMIHIFLTCSFSLFALLPPRYKSAGIQVCCTADLYKHIVGAPQRFATA
jgi:hypothetical protein